MQPTEIWTGSAAGASALFDKQYTYNPSGQAQVNNGNIFTITNVKDSTRTQTFTYDALNRLAAAQDAAHWSNIYTYDAWGNLEKKLYGPIGTGEHLDTSADTGNHLMGYGYDAGGNMTGDGVNTYAYDGENRITSVAGVSYTYDADARRVKKSSGTNYWYGPTGSVLAETDSAGVWTNYIFFGGQRLARNVNGDIKYYISDHLHSTGMFVDKAGTTAAALDDNDFYPWGGAAPGVGKTTSNNTIKFTGQYRDTESQLDYFGARYYSNVMGRFMSPDWAAKPVTVPYAEFGDPQSLNLYGFVGNSPVNRVDADGHSFAGFDGFMASKGGGGDIPMATMSDFDLDLAALLSPDINGPGSSQKQNTSSGQGTQ
ncbi:MAG: RHS repeat-associated core domain-containing protein, partial [Candidatus Angelobacter sp.]